MIWNVLIAGLQWFILKPRLNHTGSHRPTDFHSKPYLHQEKNIGLEQELPSLLHSFEILGKQLFVSGFSCLLLHAIEKGRGLILYSKKNPGPHGEVQIEAFADDKIKLAKMMIFVFDRIVNVVGKVKMLATSIVSFSHNVFKSLITQGHLKSGLCGKKLTNSLIQHFESIPNSKKLQTTTEMGYYRILRYRLHRKHCGKR